MKKNYIILAVLAVILTLVFILPAFSLRITSEAEHKSFTVALDIGDVLSSFSESEITPVLNSYVQSGITAIAVRDERELEYAQNTSLPIALMIYSGSEREDTFGEKLKNIAENYNIKYILLKDSKAQNEDKFINEICNLIAEKNLTLVLCENLSQLSNEMPEGFDKYIESSEGRILRCYETLTESYTADKNYDAIYYQMLNSAVDRNTEFILLNQLKDGDSALINAQRTMNSVSKFNQRMTEKGYTAEKEINLSEYKPNIRPIASAVAAIVVIILFVMYMMLSGRNIHYLLYLLIPTTFAVSYILPQKLLLLYPTAFSALAPCFCFTLCYLIPLKTRFGVLKTLLTAFVSLSVCAIYMCALLSGRDFYINTLTFRGVIVTLIVPVVFAGVMSIIKEKPDFRRLGRIDIIICILVLLAGAVYLIRSGNTSISETERMIRDRIVDITTARPRTKEFLIGWPCLTLMVLIKPLKTKGVLKPVISVGSSILFASVMNSFCHVFTDASTIYLRTLNGFLFSLPIILIIYIAAKKAD